MMRAMLATLFLSDGGAVQVHPIKTRVECASLVSA
jgi:hypothetical protein